MSSLVAAPANGWGLGLRWRRRVLVAGALVGILALLWLVRTASATAWIPATWAADPQGRLILQSSPVSDLAAVRGQAVAALGASGDVPTPVDARLLQPSRLWQPGSASQNDAQHQQQALFDAVAGGPVRLHLVGGGTVDVHPQPRGLAGLGLLFWPPAVLALLLYGAGLVVTLARPQGMGLPYALAAACQTVNLGLIALESVRGPAGAAPWLFVDPWLRHGLDIVTAAAVVHGFERHRRWREQHSEEAAGARSAPNAGPGYALLVWSLAIPTALGLSRLPEVQAWWGLQGLGLALGALAVWRARLVGHTPDPQAKALRQLAAGSLASLVLATAAVAMAPALPGLPQALASGALVIWHLLLAAVLLVVPLLARGRQLLHEFGLLAAVTAVATALDLLFVAVFSIGPFASMTAAMFIALAVYAAARQRVLQRLLGRQMLTTERTFEHLYRSARQLQTWPQPLPQALADLLGALFEPLTQQAVRPAPRRSQVVEDGSALLVPTPDGEGEEGARSAQLLRYAQGGRRLFTPDDARLADRVVEQLQHIVAYDQAVERGRREERLRIAQDLHDDIGARLLTLMYKAGSPELEEYIRHTLQDLKTLTRGLSTGDRLLSEAAAEWKADVVQRLAAARVQLTWETALHRDFRLSVVQWSALTRVLRELVSNALVHGQATHIAIHLALDTTRLHLSVQDDGRGGQPQDWSHGLGLGGIRKRVKQMGGQVCWLCTKPRGIRCQVDLPMTDGSP